MDLKILKAGEVGLTNIYTLTDPFSGLVRYVGKADNIQIRLNEHIRKSKYKRTYKDKWVYSIVKQNSLPLIEVVDIVSIEEVAFWENFWIGQFKSWGFKLTNMATGGIGGNLGELVNQKISNSKKGSKHTEDTKKLLSKIKTGTKHSDETKAKFTEIRKGAGNPMWGKKRPESSKNYQKILQMDLDGNIIKEWVGVTIAAKELKISRQAITDVCYGRHKTAGGFKWVKI